MDNIYSLCVSPDSDDDDNVGVLYYSWNRNVYMLWVDQISDAFNCKTVVESESFDICYGQADFIIEEEFHLSDHMACSRSGTLLFIKTDSSNVVECGFDCDTSVIKYPFAGTDNVARSLMTWDRLCCSITCFDDLLPLDCKEYIVRFSWSMTCVHSFHVHLANRLQNKLTILKINSLTKQSDVIYQEFSSTWVRISQSFLEIGQDDYLLSSFVAPSDCFQLVRLQDGNITALFPVGMELHMETNLIGSQDGFVYFFSRHLDKPIEWNLFCINLESNEISNLTPYPGYTFNCISYQGDLLLLKRENMISLPRFMVCKIRGGRLDILYQSPSVLDCAFDSCFNEITLGSPKFFTDAAKEVLPVPILMKNKKSHSLLLFPNSVDTISCLFVKVYCGPESLLITNEFNNVFSSLCKSLLRAGIYVLFVESSNSNLNGYKAEDGFYRNLGTFEYKDILETVSKIMEIYQLSPKKIAIHGWSYGGYIALKAISNTSLFNYCFACAVPFNWKLYDTGYTERYLGLPQQRSINYDISNFSREEVIRLIKYSQEKCLYLMHGVQDDNVLFDNFILLHKTLGSESRAQIQIFRDGHSLRNERNRELFIEIILNTLLFK